MKRTAIWAIIAAILATSCYNEGKLVDNPAPLMQYQFKPTEASLLAVAKAYAEAINANQKNNVMHPGQYADYGVALAQLGCREQANVMFNNEKTFFPNSSKYVDYLKQTLTPYYASDNHADTTRIDIKTLDTIHITLTPEEIALQQQIESDPEYQQLQKQLQKEEREQKAIALKKSKELKAKEQAEQRKALAKEKERQQKEKAAAKKQAEKERAAAKKQAEKDKALAKKNAEKAKAQAKKDAERQKTADEKAKNEAIKAQQKAEKEAAKAQKQAEKEARNTKESAE